MRLLAIDTCLNACSAAVVDDNQVLAEAFEPMQRGHQERLATLVAEVVDRSGLAFADLDRIGVTIGPGSFTGLRVGLAFAKGLGAALSIPLSGVGVLEALAASVDVRGEAVSVINAKRGQAFLQVFRNGVSLNDPSNVVLEDLAIAMATLSGTPTLIGPGIDLLTEMFPAAPAFRLQAPSSVAIARLAMSRPPGRTSPLYLRAPDARPMAQ